MKRTTFILLAGTTVWLAACNKSPEAVPAGAAGKGRGTIGVSLLTLDNPFFKVIGDNITAEGAKFGYDTLVVSGDKDPAKQGNQIKDFIVKKVSAIVLSPCDSKASVAVIKEANAAGIPVFTVDIPCNEPGVEIVTQIATDNYGGGKEAAKAMIEALQKGDEVITAGGILGRISKITEAYVTLEIAPNTEISVQKAAVQTLLPKGTLKTLQ